MILVNLAAIFLTLVHPGWKAKFFHLRRALLPAMLHRSMPVEGQDPSALLEEAGFERMELRDTQIMMFGYLWGYARK